MNADHDFDRIAQAWLADGPEQLSDRVLDAVVDEIHQTRQRHAMRVPRRFSTMTTPARVAAAAVIGVLLVGGGILYLGRPKDTNVAQPAPSSSASPSPSSPAAGSMTGEATAVAAGYRYTCALTKGGGVRCWGANGYGQLGNGTTTDSLVPVDVSGLTSGVRAIALGYHHSCAMTNLGGVRCWGQNDGGQLGDGTTTDSSVPVDVSGLTSGATAIAAGAGWACAITSAGGPKCWGWNGAGQLGNGSTNNTGTGGPGDVIGLGAGVTSIAGGARHTCAVTDGGAKCFGNNYNGELGDGSTTRGVQPVAVSGLTSGVAAVATGDYFSCALLDTGGVKCWGLNALGQLGNGRTTDSGVPVDVSGLATGATAIAASDSGSFTDGWHTCVVMTGGGAKCWGLNDDGQLGNGTTTDSSVPVDVTGLAGATAITAGGGGHSCAITASGIKCWGANDQGQLGDGTTTNSSIPVAVKGL